MIKTLLKLSGVSSLAIYLILGGIGSAGAYGYWLHVKHKIIAERDSYWIARMQAETNRINEIVNVQRREAAERTAISEQNISRLQKEIDDAEVQSQTSPDASSVSLDADRVRRIDSIH
jgi:hypothetical protein